MAEPVLHPATARQLENLQSKPPHALLLSGPPGTGKGTIATYMAERVLELAPHSADKYAYFRRIVPNDKNSIGIDEVRELEHLLALKIPGKRPLARAIVIEDSHTLTTEAQNALLKTLEEPPVDTVLILTTSHEQALLPTIRSRVQSISIQKPEPAAVRRHFAAQADDKTLDQLLMISGGLPGLLASLLDSTSEHPLKEAVAVARDILQKPAYERLLMVDALAKRKSFANDVCFILLQMADVALTKTDGAAFKRWQSILANTYRAQEQLLANGQPKLVLTHLMLAL